MCYILLCTVVKLHLRSENKFGPLCCIPSLLITYQFKSTNNFGIDKATFCNRQYLFLGTVQNLSQTRHINAQTKLTSNVIELSNFQKKILFIVSHRYKKISCEIIKCQVKNTQHLAKLWNLPSQDSVDVKSLYTLKNQLDKFMGERFIQGLLSTKCLQATEW